MQQPSKKTAIHEIDAHNSRLAMQQLRRDSNRILGLLFVSLLVSILTYRLGVCFYESLVCLALACMAFVMIQLFIKQSKNEGKKSNGKSEYRQSRV